MNIVYFTVKVKPRCEKNNETNAVDTDNKAGYIISRLRLTANQEIMDAVFQR
jgi:hypothetical protein